jgi:hypothetical protein
MKTQGILMAALLLSGAAFAQNTPVKAAGSAKAAQTIEARKSGLQSATDASAAAHATVDPQAVKDAKAKVENKVQATADHVSATKAAAIETVQSTAADNAQAEVKINAKTRVRADHSATNAGVSSNVKIPAVHTQAVPVKVNTRVNAGAGLRIL